MRWWGWAEWPVWYGLWTTELAWDWCESGRGRVVVNNPALFSMRYFVQGVIDCSFWNSGFKTKRKGYVLTAPSLFTTLNSDFDFDSCLQYEVALVMYTETRWILQHHFGLHSISEIVVNNQDLSLELLYCMSSRQRSLYLFVHRFDFRFAVQLLCRGEAYLMLYLASHPSFESFESLELFSRK